GHLSTGAQGSKKLAFARTRPPHRCGVPTRGPTIAFSSLVGWPRSPEGNDRGSGDQRPSTGGRLLAGPPANPLPGGSARGGPTPPPPSRNRRRGENCEQDSDDARGQSHSAPRSTVVRHRKGA